MFYQKLLSWVRAFNSGNEEAIRFFTQVFHVDEPFAVRLLLLYVFQEDEEFVLGYLDWAFNQSSQVIVKLCNLGHDPLQNLSLTQCKTLANFLKKWIFTHNFNNSPLLQELNLELVKKLVSIYKSDAVQCSRIIQSLMSWIKPSLDFCNLVAETKNRNIIIPVFFNWINHIQLEHQQELSFCPEYWQIDWSLLAYATEEDLNCLENICTFPISYQLLNRCLVLDKTHLLARFLSSCDLARLEIDNTNFIPFFQALCHSQLNDHYVKNSYLYFRSIFPDLFQPCTPFLELLVESGRVEFISRYLNHFPIAQGNTLRLWLLSIHDGKHEGLLQKLRQTPFFRKIRYADLLSEDGKFISEFRKLNDSESYFVNF